MRLVNDLEVNSESLEISELICRIEARPDDRWRREREPVQRLRKVLPIPATNHETVFCFSIEDRPERPGATVWLERRGPEKLVVSHVAPAGRRALADEEYNAILGDFDSAVLQPLTQSLDVDVHIISPKDKLEGSISPDAMESLRSFSKDAMESGYQNLDRRTWKRFLVRSHVDGSVFEGADLDWWLKQEGWPDENRRRCVRRYETDLSLLAEYDEERVPS